ncbi:hypothetical protein CC2G_009609 [Coprinopsis cinerea AmutBmut pab1-1]|nr:hypothetical protein CC2G_009609 [Coprinopsis cinerea AmutBmut pab1-1]
MINIPTSLRRVGKKEEATGAPPDAIPGAFRLAPPSLQHQARRTVTISGNQRSRLGMRKPAAPIVREGSTPQVQCNFLKQNGKESGLQKQSREVWSIGKLD